MFIILLLLIVAGGGLFAYTQGYGFPSKQEQVNALFADPENANVFASSVDDAKKQRMVDMLVKDDTPDIKGEANELSTAEVYVNANASESSEVPYKVTMVRDGIGWKVSNVQLAFTSQS